jgi:hypothetical protein
MFLRLRADAARMPTLNSQRTSTPHSPKGSHPLQNLKGISAEDFGIHAITFLLSTDGLSRDGLNSASHEAISQTPIKKKKGEPLE